MASSRFLYLILPCFLHFFRLGIERFGAGVVDFFRRRLGRLFIVLPPVGGRRLGYIDSPMNGEFRSLSKTYSLTRAKYCRFYASRNAERTCRTHGTLTALPSSFHSCRVDKFVGKMKESGKPMSLATSRGEKRRKPFEVLKYEPLLTLLFP